MPIVPLLIALASPLLAADPAAETALVFHSGDREVLRLTAADMAKRPGARTVEIDDLFYKKRKKYKAVPLKDLLTAAYGGAWGENALGEAFFDALDGYRSHAKVSVLMNPGGMIAFAEDGGAAWEESAARKGNPGPFRLVWTGPEQTAKKGFPWPWQITSIKMTVLEDEYPNALPKGAAPDSAAVKGWGTFRRLCISCHAMSGDGGTLGPDLNAPRGITRYQDRRFLKAFIKRASSFRHTKMSDFDELDERQLDELLAYFDHLSQLHGTK